MTFRSISRRTLELMHQSVRTMGVAPLGVPPGRGDATAPSDSSYAVADEILRVLPFVPVEDGPYARQYMLQLADEMDAPDFTARSGAVGTWAAGTTFPFGEDVVPTGGRFKKLGVTVRIDNLMAGEAAQDLLDIQVDLARIALLRALSEALWHSAPATDDGPELAGLPFFLTAGGAQEVDYDPVRGMIGGLAEIEARVRPGDDGLGAGPDAFVMSARARWRLMKEMEDKGLQPEVRVTPLLGQPVLHYHGLPVLQGRLPEPAGAPALTEAWAVKLSGPSAIRVLHVDGDEFGLRVDPVTTIAGLDGRGEAQSATRGAEVFGVWSVLVPDPRSVARLRRVPAGDPFSQP